MFHCVSINSARLTKEFLATFHTQIHTNQICNTLQKHSRGQFVCLKYRNTMKHKIFLRFIFKVYFCTTKHRHMKKTIICKHAKNILLAILCFVISKPTSLCAQNIEDDFCYITLNNNKKVLCDNDSIILDFIDPKENADSVVWYIKMDDFYKKICVLYPDSKPYCFKVSPHSLGCHFHKYMELNRMECCGNSKWNKTFEKSSKEYRWDTSGMCQFVERIHYHTDSENKTSMFTLPTTYQLDVLPSPPILEALDVWPVFEDNTYDIYVKIRFHNMENYDYACLSYIEQDIIGYYTVVTDTVFDSDFKGDYVLLTTLLSSVFCTAYNRYGCTEGPYLKLDPTGIESHKYQNPTININRNTLEVKGEGRYDITICSIDGTKIYSCRVMDTTTITLNPGIYLVNIQNTNNKSITKKICIK